MSRKRKSGHLQLQTFSEGWDQVPSWEDGELRSLQSYGQDTQALTYVDSSGEVAACLIFRIEDDVCFCESSWVEPHVRGRGLATKLHEEVHARYPDLPMNLEAGSNLSMTRAIERINEQAGHRSPEPRVKPPTFGYDVPAPGEAQTYSPNTGIGW